MRHLAEQLTLVKREVEDLNKDIKESSGDCTQQIRTIDRTGPINAAVINIEIREINRVVTATKLNGSDGSYQELSEF